MLPVLKAVIKTNADLTSAITSTYLADVACAVVCVFLMLLIVHLIKWQPGKVDNSGAVRRLWFFLICFFCFLSAIALNWSLFMSNITVPAFTSKYMTHFFLGAFAASAVYFCIGFVLIKMAKIGTKLESIFPKKS